MRLSLEAVRRLAAARGESLSALLVRSGVSRTAFYSLARRKSLLPGTVHALASALGVAPAELLDAPRPPSPDWIASRLKTAQRICRQAPEASFENVWHTLTLLDLDPVDRLNRSLTRGRARALHA